MSVRSLFLVLASTLLLEILGTSALRSAARPSEASAEAWTQWGGPRGDFSSPGEGLAVEWSEAGPKVLWTRPLGDGFASILHREARLYTMESRDGVEVALCLDAATGETVWESHDGPSNYAGQEGFGAGPRSTPLLTGDLLITVGITGRMRALKAGTGEPVWIRELLRGDPSGTTLSHGYASSPIAFEDLVLALVGGDGNALVAIERATGEIAWRKGSFQNSYSSPRLVKIAGRMHVLAFMAEHLVGLDPRTGEELWRFAHSNQWQTNISTPLVSNGEILFISSPQAGSRGLRILPTEEGFEVEELWSTRRVQVYHATTAQQNNLVVASSGVTSPAFLMALDVETGEIAWKKRGFAKANVVAVGERIILLDEDGLLALATASVDDLQIHARTQLFEGPSWTPPILVGTTLYARNRERILAVDLGETPRGEPEAEAPTSTAR